MKKTKRKNKSYSAEFKISVIMDMLEHHLGYYETVRKYWNISDGQERKYNNTVKRWERIYLEEGAEGLMKERRGKACKASGTLKGKKPKLDNKVEEDLIAENQRLRMEIEYLKKLSALVVLELRQKYPLKDLLKLSGIARSTYYYYLKQQDNDKYAAEKVDIVEIFEKNKGIYGYRRITEQLKKNGYTINHKTVLKLMRSLNLKGKQGKNSKYRSYKGEVGKIASNILRRNFTANKPFEKLTTDITEFKVGSNKVYFSPVMDLFNREIVSYSISLIPNLEQIRDMLNGLFSRLPSTARPILHSDQGWQYQHYQYQKLLAENNIIQSMSCKGNCLDNAAMENFFGRLKVEMFYGENFKTVEDFISSLRDYIYYYNNQRISLKLKGMSPVQYRTHSKLI